MNSDVVRRVCKYECEGEPEFELKFEFAFAKKLNYYRCVQKRYQINKQKQKILSIKKR